MPDILAVRIGQPAVLGELVAGVALGSFDLAGIGWFRGIEADVTVDILARLGVIILGWGAGAMLLPDRSIYVQAFLGAMLTATSVGITARVLQDLGRSQSPEARVILGAAVIDDVLGLVILAVVGGIIATANQGGSISYNEVGLILVKAVAFLIRRAGAWCLPLAQGVRRGLTHERPGVLLATALVFCFVLAYLAAVIGLAPIVGAYAAGLILEAVVIVVIVTTMAIPPALKWSLARAGRRVLNRMLGQLSDATNCDGIG